MVTPETEADWVREACRLTSRALEIKVAADASAGVPAEEMSNGALLAQMASRVPADLEDRDAPTGERFRIGILHCPHGGQTAAPEAEVCPGPFRRPPEGPSSIGITTVARYPAAPTGCGWTCTPWSRSAGVGTSTTTSCTPAWPAASD